MRVLTMGTFDLLHPGHLHLFAWCRRLAGPDGHVVATVNSDAFVERYKGRRPVMRQRDRLAVVSALAVVDHAFVHDQVAGGNARPTIAQAKPNVIVIGEDWYDRDYHAQLGVDPEWLLTRPEGPVFVAYVPLADGYSSTALREAMA